MGQQVKQLSVKNQMAELNAEIENSVYYSDVLPRPDILSKIDVKNEGTKKDKAVEEELKSLIQYKPNNNNTSLFDFVSQKSEDIKTQIEHQIKSIDTPFKGALKQSENLRVAQEHISSLESEIDRLRNENEDLTATAEVFEERLDKIIIQNDKLKNIYEESREEFKDEKRTLMDTLKEQTRELEKKESKTKDLEKRLSGNIQHIRVREKELENRLELIKLDKQNLTREKDQYILNLKCKMENLKEALENQQNKQNEKVQKINDYKSKSRRATNGLQMVLQVLKSNYVSEEEPEHTEESQNNEELQNNEDSENKD